LINPEIQIKLTSKKEEIISLCLKYHIVSVHVFGSVIRNDFRKESDIDLLVEFDKEFIPGFFTFMKIQKEFSALFERQVDLNTKDDLHDYFRERVQKEAEKIYVAA
jgi:uncharacterized protein